MREFIERSLDSWFPDRALRNEAFAKLIANEDSYLHATGWLRSSLAGKPIDHDGNPTPWMNFAVIAFLNERLATDQRLFEYGSGYSTTFYAARVRSVVSVEYDVDWYETVAAGVPGNVQMMFREQDSDGEYCRVITSMGDQYDVVIVDGRDRVNCVKQSLTALSPRGVIVLDDSERPRYQPGIDFATSHGFKSLHLEGLKATAAKAFRTTILYRAGNCLGL